MDSLLILLLCAFSSLRMGEQERRVTQSILEKDQLTEVTYWYLD
ncbi:hypothetical protein [Sporosarcina psychrophila]|uniref:Uncharacterized protein n=1 Tax=Sporosarcina psychrophila TaxID=1476 RepID=A0ABV2KEG6_SPOPS